MIFPIGDTNVKGGYKPFFSYSLIAINIIIFLIQVSVPGNLVCEFATIPSDISEGSRFFTLFTSMFLHGGWMHLIGNMMFLWIFADNIEAIIGNRNFIFFYLLGGLFSAVVHISEGSRFFTLFTSMFLHGGWMHLIGNMMFLWIFADNIEAIIGNRNFIIFYLLGGLFSAVVHIWIELNTGSGASLAACCMPCASDVGCVGTDAICSGSIPSLGASGAISAVMGAYIVMFPKSRIKVLFFIMTFEVAAIYFLGFWFAEQLFSGVGSIGPLTGSEGGVAWWAHIGGFVFGLVFGFLNREKMQEITKRY